VRNEGSGPSRLRRLGPPLIYGFVAFGLGVVFIVATAASRAAPKDIHLTSSTRPPQTGTEGSSTAVADDSGALILTPIERGYTVTGEARNGKLVWHRRVMLPAVVLGCGPCTSALVLLKNGDVVKMGVRVKAYFRHSVQRGVKPNRVFGTKGLGLPTNQAAWFGRSQKGVLYAYPLLGSKRAPIAVPLDVDQEGDAVLALSSLRRTAVAVSPTVDPLRIGELTVTRSKGTTMRPIVTDIPLHLSSLDQSMQPSVCINRDGTRYAAVLPDSSGSIVISGSMSERKTHKQVLPVGQDGPPVGCAFTSAGLLVYGGVPGHPTGLRAIWLEPSTAAREISGVNAIEVEACAKDGSLVVEGEDGGAAVVSRQHLERVPQATGAGCTPRGTPWVLLKRRVKWLSN